MSMEPDISSNAACVNSPRFDFNTRKLLMMPAVVMVSSLPVDAFSPETSAIPRAFSPSSLSAYFSSGCQVMKNPRISFSAANR
jgi:hypothetical protein